MKSKPLLRKWAKFHDILVGYVYDHPDFEPGKKVVTKFCAEIDEVAGMARCADGDYRLGEPGTVAEHYIYNEYEPGIIRRVLGSFFK